jgi:hypothetical protein
MTERDAFVINRSGIHNGDVVHMTFDGMTMQTNDKKIVMGWNGEVKICTGPVKNICEVFKCHGKLQVKNNEVWCGDLKL